MYDLFGFKFDHSIFFYICVQWTMHIGYPIKLKNPDFTRIMTVFNSSMLISFILSIYLLEFLYLSLKCKFGVQNNLKTYEIMRSFNHIVHIVFAESHNINWSSLLRKRTRFNYWSVFVKKLSKYFYFLRMFVYSKF